MRKERRKVKDTRPDTNLLVNLVKRSGVVEAAVPDFIDNSSSVFVVLTAGSVGDRQGSSPSYTLLELLCNVPLAASKELTTEAAFSRQSGCTDLLIRSDGVFKTAL
jgi:hypothetical protein